MATLVLAHTLVQGITEAPRRARELAAEDARQFWPISLSCSLMHAA